jgi:hypothetical protein
MKRFSECLDCFYSEIYLPVEKSMSLDRNGNEDFDCDFRLQCHFSYKFDFREIPKEEKMNDFFYKLRDSDQNFKKDENCQKIIKDCPLEKWIEKTNEDKK